MKTAYGDHLTVTLDGHVATVMIDRPPNHHVSVELSVEEGQALLVPKGFAHGYATLVPDTTVFYKVDAHYAPANDAGIFWSDPSLGIKWPLTAQEAILTLRTDEVRYRRPVPESEIRRNARQSPPPGLAE